MKNEEALNASGVTISDSHVRFPNINIALPFSVLSHFCTNQQVVEMYFESDIYATTLIKAGRVMRK